MTMAEKAAAAEQEMVDLIKAAHTQPSHTFKAPEDFGTLRKSFGHGPGSSVVKMPAGSANDALQIQITHIPTRNKITFEGWVTNFADQFNSTWSGTPAYGRMDDLYTFQRTGRKISMAFDVVAHSGDKAKNNAQKLNRLTQFLYPVYSDEFGTKCDTATGQSTSVELARNQRVLTSPPLLKLHWANMAENVQTGEGLVGFLGGFSYAPIMTSGQFIKSSGGILNFQHFSVTLDFTVLHTHLTGWSRDSSGNYVFGGSEAERNKLASFPHKASNVVVEGVWSRDKGAMITVAAPAEVGNQEAEAEQCAVLK